MDKNITHKQQQCQNGNECFNGRPKEDKNNSTEEEYFPPLRKAR